MGQIPLRALSDNARRLTLDHLWVITILLLAWLFISVLPLPPNDLWWHMAAGRTMVSEGALVHTNRWAYTLPSDAPYIYQSWLSEVILYGLWRIGNVPLLTLARTGAIVASYGLVAWHAWRRAGSGRAVAVALFLAVLIGWNNWTLRPQTLALLPGAAFLVVLREYLEGRFAGRWLWALPLIMIVWVNMHGSFMLGAGLLALSWPGTIITAMRGDAEDAPRAQRAVGPLTLAAGGTLLAMLVNPLGIGIFGYVHMMTTHSSLQQWFVEWFPPDPAIDVMNTGFWFFASVLLLAVLMASGPRRPSATDLLWYCALSWLTFGGVRYAIWFALALMPLLAAQLAPFVAQRRPSLLPLPFIATYGLLMGAALIAVLPWFQPGRYLGTEAERLFATTGRYRMLLGNTTPIAATHWLAEHPIEGNFWADMSYTSYTIWELPRKQVFADLRVELFPEHIWRDYFAIARGDAHSLALLNQWDITHLMVDQHWQDDLYTRLKQSPDWCEAYHDSRAAVMVRREYCPRSGLSPPQPGGRQPAHRAVSEIYHSIITYNTGTCGS